MPLDIYFWGWGWGVCNQNEVWYLLVSIHHNLCLQRFQRSARTSLHTSWSSTAHSISKDKYAEIWTRYKLSYNVKLNSDYHLHTCKQSESSKERHSPRGDRRHHPTEKVAARDVCAWISTVWGRCHDLTIVRNHGIWWRCSNISIWRHFPNVL